MSDPVPSHPVVKRPSRLWAWLRAIEFGIQFILGAGIVLYGIHFYRLSVAFQATLDEMDRDHPGWRLQDIEKAREVIPDSENSALRIAEVDGLLPDHWMDEDVAKQVQLLPPQTQLGLDQLARLQQGLGQVQPALEVARTLADLPKGRYAITYRPGGADPDTQKVFGTQVPKAIQLLRQDVVAALQAGDRRAAVRSTRAGLNVARSIGDEPGAFPQLARLVTVAIALKNVQRLLAQSEPDENELETLQAAVETEERHPYWPTALRGERALQDLSLEAMAKGELVPLDEEQGRPPSGWMDRKASYYFYRELALCWGPQLFDEFSRLAGTEEMPAYVRQPILDQLSREIHKSFNPALLFFPALAKISEACTRVQAGLRCEATALAAERYRRLHGEWPPSLDALIPDFLSAVPSDPFTGNPLLYHRLPDGVVIYSVSKDGVDNGGNVDTENPALPGADLGIRLWDAAKRRQPPAPPAPAH